MLHHIVTFNNICKSAYFNIYVLKQYNLTSNQKETDTRVVLYSIYAQRIHVTLAHGDLGSVTSAHFAYLGPVTPAHFFSSRSSLATVDSQVKPSNSLQT